MFRVNRRLCYCSGLFQKGFHKLCCGCSSSRRLDMAQGRRKITVSGRERMRKWKGRSRISSTQMEVEKESESHFPVQSRG